MDSIKVTYKLRRHDSPNFHGWIIWECFGDFMEEEYFSTISRKEALEVMKDLGAMQRQFHFHFQM